MTLNFKFLAYSLKNRHPGKHHCPFLSPQKIVRLFPVKELKLSRSLIDKIPNI